MKKTLAILLLYTLITILMLSSFFPLSNLDNEIFGGDAKYDAYTFAWENKILLENPLRLFDANIFYPHANSLAYVEHLFGTGLITFPIYHLTENPVLAYNLAYIIVSIMVAFFMYLLADYYTGNKYAAFIAGLVFAFSQIRLEHSGQFTLLSAQYIPLTILFFHKLWDYNSYKYAALFGLFFVLQALSGWYPFIFLIISLIVLFFYEVILTKKEVLFSILKKLTIVLLISFILILPFIIPYYMINKVENHETPLEQLPKNSARFSLYLLPFSLTIPYLFIGKYFEYDLGGGDVNSSLGLITIALSLIAIILFIRNLLSSKSKKIQSYINPYIVIGIIGFILSLGPYLYLFGKLTDIRLPYYFIHEYVPLIGFIRSPARFAFLMAFSISILAGFGANMILKRFISRKLILTILISFLILGESFPLGGPRADEFNIPQIYYWLKDQDINAIAELPIYYGTSASNYIKNANYVLYSTAHWKNILNGYSDRAPREYHNFLIPLLRSFPSSSSLCYLKKFNTSHVIVHASDVKDYYGIDIKNIAKNKDLELLKQENDIYIFKIREMDC